MYDFVCACVSSCLSEARCWHTTDPQLACGGSLFYSQCDDWEVAVCVCMCGGNDEPQTSAKAAGSSSAQVKHSDEVVPASASWEEKPPFTVVWSLISMFWTTDVFYVKKYTFHSMECLHWQAILTDIMWLYVIVITLPVLPVFLLNFDKLLWRRFPRWPADQMDGGESNLNLIFCYHSKWAFHDLVSCSRL